VTFSTLRRTTTAAAVLALALSVSACSSSSSSSSPAASGGSSGSAATGGGSATELDGVGSTAQKAAMTAWITGFQQANSGVTVNYDAQGSGAGRSQFLGGGKIAFAGSDSPLSAAEKTTAQTRCGTEGAIDIPVYLSAIAVIFNVKGITDLKLSPDTIAKIFDQKITKWNDPAIAADNPGVTLPGTSITPVNRSDNSGTTTNFTEYLSKAAPSSWSYAPNGVWPVKGGEQGDGTAGMISAVTAGDGSIGYADLSQAKGVGIAQVKVGSAFVAPSADGAAKDLEQSTKASTATGNDLSYTIDRTPTSAGAYPIVLLSYHIVCQHYTDAAQGKLVKDFETYVTSAAGQAAAASAAGSAPLSATVLATIKTSVDSIKVG
jgi:phosphate transport system substrate-binding protein